MKLKKNEKRKSESGAIMLEVVAVLSLMGLMGTVLYRQIYQRNQELHNIQMASEIRIVKEAFSAWIHANTAPLYDMCGMSDPDIKNNPGLVKPCSAVPLDKIEPYLPDGYFFEGGAGAASLGDNYDFHLFGYWRGTGGAAIPTYYGVVVPIAKNMLPDEGGNSDTWNFRRAARVAMLIGIDGGAYDKNITYNSELETYEIVGSVGTWSLDAEGILFDIGASPSTIPTYVAMTGLDVFQPEVELPSIQAGLPEDHWSMAFQRLNAYGLFTVGREETGCFTRGSRQATPNAAGVFEIGSDTIDAPGPGPGESCQPAFWVTTGGGTANETGHVYVLNDLHVGADPSGAAESAIQLKKEGAIVFNQKAQDLQNENKDTNYLLDPAYTSVMNDVKLMSRGGAKLSEILPNYILKDVQRKTGQATVDLPSCPNGYGRAVKVTPISWRDEAIDTTADKGKIEGGTTASGGTDPGHTHDLRDISVTLPDTLAKVQNRSVVVTLDTITSSATITPYQDQDNNKMDSNAEFDVHLYCIWPDGIDIDGDGTPESVATPDSERGEDSDFSPDDTYCNSFNNAPGTCTLMGCEWDSSDGCIKKSTES